MLSIYFILLIIVLCIMQFNYKLIFAKIKIIIQIRQWDDNTGTIVQPRQELIFQQKTWNSAFKCCSPYLNSYTHKIQSLYEYTVIKDEII